jgi:hypothetical protein
MTKISTAVARRRFSHVANRALLEAMEDRIDADDGRQALADMKAKGEKPIPLAKVSKRLGL